MKREAIYFEGENGQKLVEVFLDGHCIVKWNTALTPIIMQTVFAESVPTLKQRHRRSCEPIFSFVCELVEAEMTCVRAIAHEGCNFPALDQGWQLC